MDTLLDALQEGRLIELPDNNKEHALQFLAHILEAIPSVPINTDIVGLVMEREASTNTALGRGWASPHARVNFEEDLMCVIGWSPQGIDYGAPDGIPVSVIAMYLVPSNQRNHYLREISLLAKALRAHPELDRMRSAHDLNEVRNYLLDLISTAKETIGPDARARMIRLQARPILDEIPPHDLSHLIIEPLTLIAAPGIKPLVLTQNLELMEAIESKVGSWIDQLESEGVVQNNGWRIVKRAMTVYQGSRVVYDCLAIRSALKR
ncbi:MAG TPA: PTS sugar transporter subunit IIA [Syntrophales bacterium]|nr:PTS sugar transporter subunit IIA [Syntrophales bacterium]HOL59291.1 PTS sugar transporter subunit IIA [Syntrophales bacterium]HPO35516.1 PTS sugar transporter subunit IIA [Syntrophales bacterium]